MQGGADSTLLTATPDCLPHERPCEAPHLVDKSTALPPVGEQAVQSPQVLCVETKSEPVQPPTAAQAPSRPHTPYPASERHGYLQQSGAGRSSPAACARTAALLCSMRAPSVSMAARQKSIRVLAAGKSHHNTPPATRSSLKAESTGQMKPSLMRHGRLCVWQCAGHQLGEVLGIGPKAGYAVLVRPARRGARYERFVVAMPDRSRHASTKEEALYMGRQVLRAALWCEAMRSGC